MQTRPEAGGEIIWFAALIPACPFRNLGKSGLRVSCLGLGRCTRARTVQALDGSDRNLLSFHTGTWVTFGGQVTDQVGHNRLRTGLRPVSVKPSGPAVCSDLFWTAQLDVNVVVILLLKVAEDLLTLAYENGINLFDTAEVYNAGK